MRAVLTVTALNNRIKELIEENFDSLWVEGEISNLRRPASGHLYFTLKDETSQIRAVIFRSAIPRDAGRRFFPEEGMGVLCRARLSVYEPRGEYQLIIDMIEPLGVGALQKAFEQLRARLAAEGLFAAERKRPVPFLPGRIGVVTSPSGAVIRDILTVTGRRCPSVHILIAPVRVQGEGASAEIAAAIERLNAVGRIDVIIVARGGGALEDLAPFNDEAVARAIYRSAVPVVSAVGHETDYTIADFVADLRAPTPSAAAELVVPMRRDVAARVDHLTRQLTAGLHRSSDRRRERLALAERRLASPARRVADLRLAVDDASERLRNIFTARQELRRHRLAHARTVLVHNSPAVGIRERGVRVGRAERDMTAALQRSVTRLRERVARDMAVLDSLSPLAVLGRGYSITRRLPAGGIVRNADELETGGAVAVRLGTGGFHARVTELLPEEAYGKGQI